MTIHDWNLANQTPASYRTDHNNLNLASVSNSASSSGITTTFAHMWYADVSSSGWMRQRNAADSTFNYIFKTDVAGGVCTYSGSPSTNHIGRFVGQWVYDTSNNRYYYNTLAGTSSQATWSMVASSSAYNEAAFPDGYIAGPPPTYLSATEVQIPGGFKCRDSGNAADISFSTAFTIDITVSGAGGLSTDLTESSSQWYYLFAMRKSGDGTLNGILTTATSAPTLPSGYDQYRMLPFAVRNSSAGDFIPYKVDSGWPHRPQIFYQEHDVVIISTNFTSTSFTATSHSKFVPPIARIADALILNVSVSTAGTLSARETGSTYTNGSRLALEPGSLSGYLHYNLSTSQSADLKVTQGAWAVYTAGFVITEVN